MPTRLRAARRATDEVFDRIRPDVVVGYGGYVSLPAYLAARRRKVPYVVHEGNAVPGLANRVGARSAARVATSFPDTPIRSGEYVGLPIRRMISTLDRAALRAEARAFFGLDPDLPTVLVTGGSQGARRLNQAGLGRRGRVRRRRRPGAARPGQARGCGAGRRATRPCRTSSSTTSTGWTSPTPPPTWPCAGAGPTA